MTIQTVAGFDATHANIGQLPAGQAAGYVTGSPDIMWTAADWSAHPGAVRIDQTPASGPWDATADVDDFEAGAVTADELAPRARLRMAAFRLGTRPGQRRPAVYCSRVSVHVVANALVAGGVTSGVGLAIADWNDDEGQAAAEVAAGSGPFPVIWRQYANRGAFDAGVFSAAWLADVSAAPAGRSLVAATLKFSDGSSETFGA